MHKRTANKRFLSTIEQREWYPAGLSPLALGLRLSTVVCVCVCACLLARATRLKQSAQGESQRSAQLGPWRCMLARSLLEALRKVSGAPGHSLVLAHPATPGATTVHSQQTRTPSLASPCAPHCCCCCCRCLRWSRSCPPCALSARQPPPAAVARASAPPSTAVGQCTHHTAAHAWLR